MQREDSPQDRWRNAVFALTALLVVAADQLSKMWIRSNLATGESLPATWLFRLTRVHNTGAAFGLFPDQSFALTIVGLIGVVVLLLFALLISPRFPPLDSRLGKTALGLVLGGTVGNLIDRLNPNLNGVTDFIRIGIWPAFNVADSAVVIGVILVAYSLLFLTGAKEH
jgi:signal peptidase II